jgi:hypothetical protein
MLTFLRMYCKRLYFAVVKNLMLPLQYLPSNLLISSGGHNFVIPAANFCNLLEGLFHEISKFFKNKLTFKYFYLLMLFGAKKRLIWRFLKISILLDFVTKLIFKTPQKCPRKHQQGGKLEDSYSHEKFLLNHE